MKIRVLCVFSTLDRGGAESMCMNLYRYINREEVQFDFVKHTESIGAYEVEIIKLGGKIYTAPPFKLQNLIQYRTWWRKHFTSHPEHIIIHGHYFTASAVYFEVAKKCGRVTIGHSHTSKFDSKVKELLCKKVEKNCDYCLACGWDAGKNLYPRRHFIILNNAVDAEKFRFNEAVRKKYRNRFGFEEKHIVLGIVANFSSPKNPLGAIDLFHYISNHDDRYKLLWIGGGGDLKRQVEGKIDEYGLREKVLLLGVRDDVNNLLQAMDAFLLPSFYEGLPVVLIEAQAAGLYCLASKAVTNEVDITGRCDFLPLDDWEKWLKVLQKRNLSHIDTYDMIKRAGYDIHYTTGELEKYYLLIARNASPRQYSFQ